MDALISVIVPIYKVEQYLDKCIESLILQSYSNIEIILVDDGSPDGCPLICDKWARKDNRVTVIHKENGGLSDARNAGIDIAKGNYLAFVDSDDCVEKDYLNTLYATISDMEADIAVCNYFYSYTSGKVVESGVEMQSGVYSPKEYTNLMIHSNFGFDYAWNKLYRKDLFNQIRYKNGKCYEDVFAITDLMEVSEKISIVDKHLYYYTERDDSICGESRGRFSPKIFDLYEGWNYRAKSYLKMGWIDEALYVENRGYSSFLEVIKECYCSGQMNPDNTARIKAILKIFHQIKLIDYKAVFHSRFGDIVAMIIRKDPQKLIIYKKIQNLLKRKIM